MGNGGRPDYLFVTNSDSGDVTVIDIDSRRVIARIPVGQDPQEVVITPDNQYALVLNRKSGDVAVIRVPSIIAMGQPSQQDRAAVYHGPRGSTPGERGHQPHLTASGTCGDSRASTLRRDQQAAYSDSSGDE